MDSLSTPQAPHDRDLPEPRWPSTEWPAGPIQPPSAPPRTASTPDPSRGPAEPSTKLAGAKSYLVFAILGGVLLGTGVTLGVLAALGVLDEGDLIRSPRATPTVPTTTAPAPVEPGASISDVAAAAIPSVVAVSVIDENGLDGGGSGVVYRDGYLLTNHHVIANAEQLGVIFSDGVAYPAEIVGSDELTDIAVISTTRPDLAPITLGTEADLVIGERTVAVGNPLGLLGGPSVTSGILSATGRSLLVERDRWLYGLLQTDAPITRGSSGGALLDEEAKLIGITTAIGVSDVGAEGLGFAVPVDMAVGVAEDLIADGEVSHAMLGIQGRTVTESLGDATVPLGVEVSSITPGSAYSAAGGEMGDVIQRIAGESVTSIEQLIAILRMYRAGDEVVVEAIRGDEEITFPVELGEWQ